VIDNPWCRAPEDDYLVYLEHERHMYAWCLAQYGSRALSDAEREACDVYPYEPSDDPCRGLYFHDLAWHHAMIHLWGNCYWVDHRELERPSELYQAESTRLTATREPTVA
jgi:hypothetical protein